MSRAKLAEAMEGKISHQAIQLWESGETAPSRKNMQILAKALEVSVEWLSTGVDPGGLKEEYREIVALLDYLSDEQLARLREQLRAQRLENEKFAEKLIKLNKSAGVGA
jgi:transcriptional regulator with XRE-family HTH domain